MAIEINGKSIFGPGFNFDAGPREVLKEPDSLSWLCSRYSCCKAIIIPSADASHIRGSSGRRATHDQHAGHGQRAEDVEQVAFLEDRL